ncbi:MAG TPA: zinc-dependent alcohol dehydrogenase family protein [Acidimicrobiales bacterium]|nr:zinc-dependent alcohol dehydrogenase family protein [Acidimicrobiales bacterium]
MRDPAPIERGPLVAVDRAPPEPGPGEIVVDVAACGVCRTDLHLAEGDLQPRARDVTPGHEVVGRVRARGPGAERFDLGQRVGIPWLRGTCGSCRFCRRGAENLCLRPSFTGWDAHGGFAEQAVVHEAYAYALPEAFDDVAAAPLLCAGIVGYRALKRAHVPPGGRLGIYGFGASAHLAAQVAVAAGVEVLVCTRSPEAQRLALELGAAWAGGATERPPAPLDGAVLYAPAGDLVPAALEALDRGGRLSIAGVHLTDVPVLRYQDHLFQERELVSVTANTRADGEEFLAVASRIDLHVETTPYPLDGADRALRDLAADRVRGAAVLLA